MMSNKKLHQEIHEAMLAEYGWWGYGVIGLIILIFAGFIFISAYFEMQSFNKLTGGDASYWDAFWVNLQVNCQSLGE